MCMVLLAIDDAYIWLKCCAAYNNNTECMSTLIVPYIQGNKNGIVTIKKAIKHNIPIDKQCDMWLAVATKCLCPG